MNKSKIATIVLLIMTIGLMMAIFYIGYVLTNTSENSISIAPKKTKAQNVSYNKVIAFNTNETANNTVDDINLTVSVTPIVQDTPSPTTRIQPRTLAQGNISPTSTLTTPTVTEILTISPSETLTPEVTITTSAVSPTPIASLPKSGSLTNLFLMFGMAGVLIFFSFLF